jgi:hypothetical protein
VDDYLTWALYGALGLFYAWMLTKLVARAWFGAKRRHLDNFVETLTNNGER